MTPGPGAHTLGGSTTMQNHQDDDDTVMQDQSNESTNAPARPRKWVAANWFPILAVAAIAVLYLVQSSAGTQSVIDWGHDLPAALNSAAQNNKPVLISFSSPACRYCKQMEAEVIPQDAVKAEIGEFVPVKINAWDDQRTAAQYGVDALPAYIVAVADGTPVAAISGYIPADRFTRFLRAARTEAQQKTQ